MAETLTKQQKEWNKQLTGLIQRYSYLRDWSELAAWLSRLKNIFADRKGRVVDKNILLKRLATSLNAALPVALHEAALQIYEMLFVQSIITGQELPTASIGLFSFYGQANVKNKTRLIQIFHKHLPFFGNDLQVLATGLAITILPSLNQMNEGLVRDVTNLLDLLARPDLVGLQILAQALWAAILRSPSCRVAGLKFLSSKLGRGAQQQDNDEQDTFWNEGSTISKKQQTSQIASSVEELEKKGQYKDMMKQYCPSLQTLVVNALTMCVEDQNVLSIKAGLDFLYKYLPLKSDCISDQAKLKLTKSVVWLLGKRDTSVTRKINLWLFGKPDDQNQYSVNQKYLSFITDVLIQFLQKQTSIQPLKITINLLTQHQDLPQLILGQLVPHILEFCMKQINYGQVIKLMHRLIDRIRPHLPIFSQSLSQSLISNIDNKSYKNAQKSLNLAAFFINRIVKPQDLRNTIRSFLKLLLKGSLLTHWEDRQFMRLSLSKTVQVLQKHKQLLSQTKTGEVELNLLLEHNQLFTDLLNKIGEKKQQQMFQQQISLMNRLLFKIQQVFEISGQQWLSNTIKNISLSNPQHFLAPIEALGQVIERDSKLGKEVVESAGNEQKMNFIKVSLAKLWGILSLGHLQTRVIPLLLRLVKNFPIFFQQLLQSQFESSSELAIIKFRLFWQVAPKYPQIMSSQQVQQVSKNGLFKMLDFLDSGNPLVKYHSNLWISQTYPAFHRVLNPILQILLRPRQCWYKTIQGQYIFAVNPQIPLLLRTLRHLKSFIRLVPDKFNKFAFKPLTPKMFPLYCIFKGKDPESENNEVSYVTPLLELVVRLTESKFIGGDNNGIDLAACQLLQVFVKAIKTSQLGNVLVKNHLKHLLRSLHFATINEEHLLQIQLLDLLKLLLTEPEMRKMIDTKILKQVIASSNLVDTILQGVSCSFPYIKERFVQFLNQCIPLLLQYYPSCGQAISRVLNTYTNKIAYVHSKKVQASSLKDLQISQKNAQILILFEGIKNLLSHFLDFHLKPFQKQKNQHDTDSGLYSFYSWKSYISLKIPHAFEKDSKSKKFQQDISKQIINELPSLLSTMTDCWTLSELKPHYGLSKQGLSVFDYGVFLNHDKKLLLTIQNRLETEDSVQAFIISFFRVLLNAYPRETMRALISCWSGANKDIDTRLKLVELLIFSGLPTQNFYFILTQSINPQKIGKKRKGAALQVERIIQQDLLQLCQIFSSHNYQHENVLLTHNLINIWLSFCRFLKFFDNSRNIFTLFGVLELIDLFLHKYNPKQIVRQQKLKKDIIVLINIHNDLHHLICGKLKVQSNGTFKLSTYFPLPSSVHILRSLALQGSERIGPSFLFWEQFAGDKIAEYMRLTALSIARRISFNFIEILQNDSQIGLVRRIRDVIVSVLPLVQQKSQSGLLVEGASELILCLLKEKKDTGQLFVKEVKTEILHIFNKQDFFICSSRTLQAWASIIDLLIDSNKQHDIFQEYLEKVSLASSLFSSVTFETKKKIKSFERICFILYSGGKDKYTDRAQLLIDKISEVIKHSQAPQPVLILIFFCVRVLMLRTSQEKLTKLLSTLWQMILFLLAAVFSDSSRDKLNLHWAALKLVQMISLMQIPEFHPHQWTFFYDFVGVRFSTNAISQQNELKLNINPKIHKFLPSQIRIIKQEVPAVQQKRHLIIKQDKIDDLQLLKTKTLLLSSYLVASSGCKMQFDMKQVQELIQNDFLNLDDFIFKVK